MSTFFLYITLTVVIILMVLLYVKPFVFQTSGFGKLWTSVHEDGLTRLLMILTLWTTVGGEILLQNSTKLKIKGIGISWNKIIGPLINMIPGLILTLAMFWIIKFLGNFFSFPKGFMDFVTQTLIWIFAVVLFCYYSYKRFKNVVRVNELSASRLEVQKQGIVQSTKSISLRGSDVFLNEYVMLTEGEFEIPWFANISTRSIPLRFQQYETAKLATSASDGIQIESLFSERFLIKIPGLYFSVEEQDDKNKYAIKKAILENALLDLIQRLDSETILTLSGKQLKKILVAGIQEREWIKNSSPSDYASTQILHNAAKVIQDIYISKKMWVDMRFSDELLNDIKAAGTEGLLREPWDGGPKTEREFDEQKKAAMRNLNTEFQRFKDTIVSSVAKISIANEKLGVYTDDIVQREMNYASTEAKKAAEEKIIAKLRAEADSIRINWLKDKADELVQLWEDKSITALEAMHLIQVEFGKRTAYNFDGKNANNVNPLINVNP